MPFSTPQPSSFYSSHPSELIIRLCSPDVDLQLKSRREVKQQIIGNRTKKLAYIKLGAVPVVSSVFSRASSVDCEKRSDLLVQSATLLCSFACGLDTGVRDVIDA